MGDAPYLIAPLGPNHDRTSFSCGDIALDQYLARQASQDVRRGVARVFVATGTSPTVVAGYYCLSGAHIERAALPPEIGKRLPHYPAPAARIGRLAVDRREQGRGLGETLLLDSLRRIVRASAEVAIYAALVDAKDERAQSFYERYGFRSLRDERLSLFLPLATIEKLGL